MAPVMVLIGLIISEMYAKENIANFKKGVALHCKVNQTDYKVLKESGWELDGIYFIKDALMIRVDKCEER